MREQKNYFSMTIAFSFHLLNFNKFNYSKKSSGEVKVCRSIGAIHQLQAKTKIEVQHLEYAFPSALWSGEIFY